MTFSRGFRLNSHRRKRWRIFYTWKHVHFNVLPSRPNWIRLRFHVSILGENKALWKNQGCQNYHLKGGSSIDKSISLCNLIGKDFSFKIGLFFKCTKLMRECANILTNILSTLNSCYGLGCSFFYALIYCYLHSMSTNGTFLEYYLNMELKHGNSTSDLCKLCKTYFFWCTPKSVTW